MFKFLKDKLKAGIQKISGKIDEEGTTEESPQEEPNVEEVKKEVSEEKTEVEETPEVTEEEPAVPDTQEIKEEPIIEPTAEEPVEEKTEPVEAEKSVEEKPVEVKTESVQSEESKEIVEETPQDTAEIQEEKKGFFGKIKQSFSTKKINEKQFEDIFWEIEVILLENNVAVEVIEKIKSDLQTELVDKPLPRKQIEDTVRNTLKTSIEGLFDVEPLNLMSKIESKKPYVICLVGINGSGKTTSIAKLTKMLSDKGKTVVLAAADTFRAAAIDQLQLHADKLGVKLIKHDYGSDPAAVAFDAIKHAESKSADVVLIDTAGRIHSNSNLTDEMKKIVRVANPDVKIFVGESITGNDCVEQAQKFDEAVGIDAIILSKADIDEKGGASISVSYVTGKPIAYIGVGQEYSDLKEFDSNVVVESLGL